MPQKIRDLPARCRMTLADASIDRADNRQAGSDALKRRGERKPSSQIARGLCDDSAQALS